jgi:hypothetical protein
MQPLISPNLPQLRSAASDPIAVVERMADLVEVDDERLTLWTLAPPPAGTDFITVEVLSWRGSATHYVRSFWNRAGSASRV